MTTLRQKPIRIPKTFTDEDKEFIQKAKEKQDAIQVVVIQTLELIRNNPSKPRSIYQSAFNKTLQHAFPPPTKEEL